MRVNVELIWKETRDIQINLVALLRKGFSRAGVFFVSFAISRERKSFSISGLFHHLTQVKSRLTRGNNGNLVYKQHFIFTRLGVALGKKKYKKENFIHCYMSRDIKLLAHLTQIIF